MTGFPSRPCIHCGREVTAQAIDVCFQCFTGERPDLSVYSGSTIQGPGAPDVPDDDIDGVPSAWPNIGEQGPATEHALDYAEHVEESAGDDEVIVQYERDDGFRYELHHGSRSVRLVEGWGDG